LLSGLCFAVMILAVRGWRSAAPAIPGVPETILSGVGSGLRYARHSAPLRALVVRNISFSICASALWALLPVVARDQYQLGAGGFGLLLGCFGAGAVAGALSMPRNLRRLSLNALVNAGGVVWAVATLLIAASPYALVAILGIVAAGSAWVSVLASLSAGTQTSAPTWVRARRHASQPGHRQCDLGRPGVRVQHAPHPRGFGGGNAGPAAAESPGRRRVRR
jgi:hypothetical protein